MISGLGLQAEWSFFVIIMLIRTLCRTLFRKNVHILAFSNMYIYLVRKLAHIFTITRKQINGNILKTNAKPLKSLYSIKILSHFAL